MSCSVPLCRWRRTSTPAPRRSAIGQTTGVKAMVNVSSSAYAHAARQLGSRVPLLVNPLAAAAARAISGSSTASTAVPSRPPASAPVAAGRKAYATLPQARSSRDSTSGREAKYAMNPASGTEQTSSRVSVKPVEPRKTVLSAARAARYGGADCVPPVPTGCQPST